MHVFFIASIYIPFTSNGKDKIMKIIVSRSSNDFDLCRIKNRKAFFIHIYKQTITMSDVRANKNVVYIYDFKSIFFTFPIVGVLW